MIIDIHAHPVLLDVINEDPEDLSFRKQQFGVFKSGRNPIEFEKLLIDDARIDKVVWLPEDYSTQMGRPIVSNEEMEKIVASCPERFIGFASIDPRDPKAKEKLTYAFETQKLSGLKLNLSRLHMYADDPLLAPLYEVCLSGSHGMAMVGRDHHDVNEISKCICGYFYGLYGFSKELL